LEASQVETTTSQEKIDTPTEARSPSITIPLPKYREIPPWAWASAAIAVVIIAFLFGALSRPDATLSDADSTSGQGNSPPVNQREERQHRPTEPLVSPPDELHDRRENRPDPNDVISETPLPEKSPVSPVKPSPADSPFNKRQARKHQRDWAEFLQIDRQVTNRIAMKLTLIPPGEFQMGSPESRPYRDIDETQHRVKITKPFYLSVHEVTQKQYDDVMKQQPSRNYDPDNPVEQVHWHDASDFCRELSKREDVQYRLPTEAEWEFACRAGTETSYSFGGDTSRLGEYAWHSKNSNNSTHPVGTKTPNPWGLYDMHGNVWEWCQDWKGSYDRGQVSNPTGPAQGTSRILRGGCWADRQATRSANRYSNQPYRRDFYYGFRVVQTLSDVD
jgi:formylglycine-generating enzyme required for sulfatase activity